jgi:hypothetical protein
MDYTYAIQSVDTVQKTMVVGYQSPGLEPVQLNIGIPAAGVNLDAYLQKHAPTSKWTASSVVLMEITAGYAGTATYTAPAPAPAPTTPSTVNEEYIRALIFQVLEEIKAAAV